MTYAVTGKRAEVHPSPRHRGRRLWTVLLGTLAPLWLFGTACSCWLRFDVLSPEALGRDVRRSLSAPPVRDELARRVALAAAGRDPRAAAAEPLIRSAASIVIGSREFADAVDIAVQVAWRSVLGGGSQGEAGLASVETQVISTVGQFDPALAKRIPTGWDSQVVDLRPGSTLVRLLRDAVALARWWAVLLGSTIAWYTTWIAVARRRRAALAASGATALITGVAMLAAAAALRSVVLSTATQPGARRAVGAAYDVSISGWRSVSFALLLTGALIAGAAISGTATGRLLLIVRRAARAVIGRTPEAPIRRLGAAALVVAGGALMATAPRIGTVLVTIIGAAAAFLGVNALGAMLPNEPVARWSSRRNLFLVGVGGLSVVITPLVLWEVSSRHAAVGDAVLVCNGASDLCDKPVNQVTLAATHNSMSGADAGFLLPSQTDTMAAQLQGGIRGLLVDTHYGIPTGTGRVWTDLGRDERTPLVERVGPTAVEQAEHLRTLVIPPAGAPDVYLCHAYCELGATRAADGFGQVRTFLKQNPAEVVVLVIEDHTAGADTVGALTAAGLDRLAYRHEPGAPWPTLGELIRNGTPLIVFAQNHGGSPPWFVPAFDVMADTPFDALSADQIDCAPNRGPARSDFLLVNAWVATDLPSVELAWQVNAPEFLTDLVQRCTRLRHHVVNLVAVDFWTYGDVVSTVRRLNQGPGP